METGYKVADAMTAKPITAASSDSLRSIAELMRQHRVGSLLLKRDEELQGIVTEYDLVRKAMAAALDVEKTPAEKVMTPLTKMTTVQPDMDIFEALNLMKERTVRHLPVLQDEKLVGFLTLKDILTIQPQLFELIVDKYDVREADRKRELID